MAGRISECGITLAWWDLQGNLLLNGDERAEQQSQRADGLATQLRSLGVESKT